MFGICSATQLISIIIYQIHALFKHFYPALDKYLKITLSISVEWGMQKRTHPYHQPKLSVFSYSPIGHTKKSEFSLRFP